MALFGRKRDHRPSSSADAYNGLRRQILELAPAQLDSLAADAPILALLMETGYPEAVATLVAVADGTTSLYFSNGGGIIGAGAHEAVVAASRRWLEAGVDYVRDLADVVDPEPPPEGMTQFVAVTKSGLRAASAAEAELGAGGHRLSPLFYGGHDVITEIRLLEES